MDAPIAQYIDCPWGSSLVKSLTNVVMYPTEVYASALRIDAHTVRPLNLAPLPQTEETDYRRMGLARRTNSCFGPEL